MRRWLRSAGKRASERMFHTFQGLGLDVLPRHFYSEIPDIAKLRGSSDWRQPYTMYGVNGADVDEQLAWVRNIVSGEVRARLEQDDIHALGCRENGEPGYGRVEADLLYSLVRATKPSRIVQIGSGVSTAIALAAAEDAGYKPKLLAVDPFPTPYLRKAAAAGSIELLARPVEALGWDP